MNGFFRSAALLVSLLLSACATVAPPAPVSGDTLTGRLAVNVAATGNAAARSVSAAFELQGNADAGRLNLATPLGSVLAQARWSAGQVVLTTPQGERRYTGLDALSYEVLGESLPLAALFDWLRGRPWPGAPSVANSPPAPAGFEQLGWVVDLARYEQSAAVAASRERAPAVTLRARLDR